MVKENFKIDDDSLDSIVDIAEGDMRRSINMLQSLNIIYKNNNLDINNIYSYFNIISRNDINNIFNIIDNEDISICEKMDILENLIINEKDYNLNELLKHITDIVLEKKYSNKQLKFLFKNLSQIEETLLYDYIPEIAVSSLISILLKVKNI